MKPTDIQLEQHYKNAARRPQRKNETTITSFNRDIFWYDKDELSRQADLAAVTDLGRITYEDHRKAVEMAVNIFRKDTQHEIAMCILTNRMFKQYRAKAFSGEGSFKLDYSFLISRVGMLFNPTTSRVKPTSIAAQLQDYKTPTLVQINHITGDVVPVKVPGNKFPLNEWAIKYNQAANESTSYRITGLKVG